MKKPPPPKPGAKRPPPKAPPRSPRRAPGAGLPTDALRPKSSTEASTDEAADAEPEGPTEGTLIAGKYRLDRLIARGGMGAVWAGHDLDLERPVAVKFMAPAIAASKGLRARFLREAKAAAQLRTVHVVQIYEHGVHDGLPFMIMELLEGEDLHQKLKRERRIPLVIAAQLVTQTAKALRKAHAKGIVHRDLKPQNIFLVSEDDEQTVKILDFGIAKNVTPDSDGDTTKTGQILGSPNYMSPEQARGYKQVDHRTDLWSLAVIIFRMVTGKPAFRGEAAGDVIVKICTDPLPVASQIASDLPVAIDQFLQKALERDPDQRFQTATELAEAFVETVRACGNVAWANASGQDADNLSQPGEWTPVSGLITDAGAMDSQASLRAASVPSEPGAVSAPGASQPGVPSDPVPSDPEWSDPSPEPSRPSGAAATPLPGGGTPGSLSAPAVVALDPQPPAERSKLWLGLGAASVAVVLLALGGWALSGDETAESDGAEPAATSSPTPSAAAPEPSATASAASTGTGGATGEDEPAGGLRTEPTASVSSPPPAEPVAVKPKPKPRPKPKPKPTATETKRNWGY